MANTTKVVCDNSGLGPGLQTTGHQLLWLCLKVWAELNTFRFSLCFSLCSTSTAAEPYLFILSYEVSFVKPKILLHLACFTSFFQVDKLSFQILIDSSSVSSLDMVSILLCLHVSHLAKLQTWVGLSTGLDGIPLQQFLPSTHHLQLLKHPQL